MQNQINGDDLFKIIGRQTYTIELLTAQIQALKVENEQLKKEVESK